MNKTYLFTPQHSTEDTRIIMQINHEDDAKIRRGIWTAVITDQTTKKRWLVRSMACGIPRCHCDAQIIKEL
jgi:hypothetical protein